MGKRRQEGWQRYMCWKMTNSHSDISLYHLVSIVNCLSKWFLTCGAEIIVFDFIILLFLSLSSLHLGYTVCTVFERLWDM